MGQTPGPSSRRWSKRSSSTCVRGIPVTKRTRNLKSASGSSCSPLKINGVAAFAWTITANSTFGRSTMCFTPWTGTERSKRTVARSSTQWKRQKTGEETDYFKFRCFRNRNLHQEFKRLDLVAKLNAIAGGMRLRGESNEKEVNAG